MKTDRYLRLLVVLLFIQVGLLVCLRAGLFR